MDSREDNLELLEVIFGRSSGSILDVIRRLRITPPKPADVIDLVKVLPLPSPGLTPAGAKIIGRDLRGPGERVLPVVIDATPEIVPIRTPDTTKEDKPVTAHRNVPFFQNDLRVTMDGPIPADLANYRYCFQLGTTRHCGLTAAGVVQLQKENPVVATSSTTTTTATTATAVPDLDPAGLFGELKDFISDTLVALTEPSPDHERQIVTLQDQEAPTELLAGIEAPARSLWWLLIIAAAAVAISSSE